jgi:hypothetical protein
MFPPKAYIFQVVSPLQDLWPKFCIQFTHFPCVLQVLVISSSSTSSPYHLVKSTNYKAPHYILIVFTNLCHFLHLRSKYSFQQFILKHPYTIFFPSNEKSRFYTHTKQQAAAGQLVSIKMRRQQVPLFNTDQWTQETCEYSWGHCTQTLKVIWYNRFSGVCVAAWYCQALYYNSSTLCNISKPC